ncbi:MAG TPA: ABC transporter permease [Acidimicrobiales bacterium]|nr:ABC transporter permease [Acidimicrobiales bacterium]
MTAVAVAVASLRRVVRDRTALFFMIALPLVVILIIGATVRGFSTFRVGVVDEGAGRTGTELVAALQAAPDLRVRHYPSVGAASRAVARGEVSTAVVLPRGMDTDLRAGRTVAVPVLAERANSTQQAAAAAVAPVLAAQGARIQAALFATSAGAGSVDQNLERAGRLQATLTQVTVASRTAESRAQTLPEGFSYSAPTMLVLFVFLNALTGGTLIIENRRLGMYERMRAAPLGPATIIAGEALGFVVIALVQSVIIVATGAVVFGVSWGNWPAAVALIVTWAVVGAGAGMVSGTVFRTPEQATAIGPALGMALAMLGGCMWPLSIVNSVMRQVGHAAPQAWAVDAWTALLARGGTLGTILPQLAVLAGFAAVLLTLATLRMNRVIR